LALNLDLLQESDPVPYDLKDPIFNNGGNTEEPNVNFEGTLSP